MFVAVPFESIQGRVQHSRGVELPAIDGFGFDRAAGPFDQAIGPGMIGLGETVPNAASPAELGERMPLRGAGPTPSAIAPQCELPSIVGQHPIKAEGIEAVTVLQEGACMGHGSCRGDWHRHQSGGPIDGDEQVSARAAQPRQGERIDVQKPGRTGAEPAMRLMWARLQHPEPMEVQPDQFPIHRRATELGKHGLPQGEPHGVQIQQPVLP